MNIIDAIIKTGKYGQWMMVAALSSISAMIFSVICTHYFSLIHHFPWANIEADGYSNVFLFSVTFFAVFIYFLIKKITRQAWKFSLPIALIVFTIAFANLFFASYALYVFLIIELAAEAVLFLRRNLQ